MSETALAPPIAREDVVSYFRAFLGREPESEQVINLYQRCASLAELAAILARSKEFALRTGIADAPNFNSLRTIYPLLYGMPLDPIEETRLRHHGVADGSVSVQTIRRIIAATDRQVRSTPFLVRFGLEDVTFMRLEGFELAVDAADVAVSSIIARENSYETHLTAFFKRSLKPGMSVVDVGANIGYYTMLAASLVGSAGRVMSFEPNSENARLVLMSLQRNRYEHVTLIPVALSTKTGSAFFSPHMGSNGGLFSSVEGALASPQCIVVPTIRMDDIVDGRVDFIKVDTEGAEALILEGASRIIERDRPLISSEFSPEMLSRVSGASPLDYLLSFQQRGYRVVQLDRETGADDEYEIEDVATFMADYGNIHRVSEIVFLPRN